MNGRLHGTGDDATPYLLRAFQARAWDHVEWAVIHLGYSEDPPGSSDIEETLTSWVGPSLPRLGLDGLDDLGDLMKSAY